MYKNNLRMYSRHIYHQGSHDLLCPSSPSQLPSLFLLTHLFPLSKTEFLPNTATLYFSLCCHTQKQSPPRLSGWESIPQGGALTHGLAGLDICIAQLPCHPHPHPHFQAQVG